MLFSGDYMYCGRVPMTACPHCDRTNWANVSTFYTGRKLELQGPNWMGYTQCLSCMNVNTWEVNPDKPIEHQSHPSHTEQGFKGGL